MMKYEWTLPFCLADADKLHSQFHIRSQIYEDGMIDKLLAINPLFRNSMLYPAIWGKWNIHCRTSSCQYAVESNSTTWF